MNTIQHYIQNLKMEEVPWHRITTAYGRATEFPIYFNAVWNRQNKDEVKKALFEITTNIEHQGTLWHSTPFAMIFLVRIFESVIDDIESDEIAYFIAEQLLDFFEVIAECFHDWDNIEHDEPFSLFSAMLNEKYLWSEEYDEEDEEMMWEENELYMDDLCYNLWYYSYHTLLYFKPELEKIQNADIKEKVNRLKELL